MNDIHDDRKAVYEIGYLIVSTIAEDQVPNESDKVKKIVADAGASIIAEELPHHERLAYTMRRKTVSGSYEKYDEAYFGWVKFSVATDKIEGIKKAVEVIPSVLRMLLITTVSENTYLGKRAPAVAVAWKPAGAPAAGAQIVAEAAPATPATVEEMDKSIDEMVKEV